MTLKELKAVYGDRVMVPDRFHVEKVLEMANGCCEDLPVLLTSNLRDAGSVNWSCQCACGCWCTTGTRTAEEAIRHYQRMTEGNEIYSGRIGT